MTDYSPAEEVLRTMLAKLGFEAELQTEEEADGPCIQISSSDSSYLIGKNGDRLEDLQYLMNRIVSESHPDLPRIKVDCNGYRKEQESILLDKVKSLAEKVKEDGKSARTRPLNAYYRRLVHNSLADEKEVQTSSPDGSSRYKRVTISKVGSSE